MKNVAVYLGSHSGNGSIWCDTARELGRRIAEHGWRLIYGGSSVGTMGALADGCMDAGGECIGVFPDGFKGRPEIAASGVDVARKNLTQMKSCPNFQERKRMIEEMCDCSVALPGSWGTLDELFTNATNSELKFNGGKKIFILNLNGYYDPLKAQIKNMFDNGFILEYSTHLFRFCDTLDELIAALEQA